MWCRNIKSPEINKFGLTDKSLPPRFFRLFSIYFFRKIGIGTHELLFKILIWSDSQQQNFSAHKVLRNGFICQFQLWQPPTANHRPLLDPIFSFPSSFPSPSDPWLSRALFLYRSLEDFFENSRGDWEWGRGGGGW